MFNERFRNKILDGSLQDTKNYLYGKYKGFFM